MKDTSKHSALCLAQGKRSINSSCDYEDGYDSLPLSLLRVTSSLTVSTKIAAHSHSQPGSMFLAFITAQEHVTYSVMFLFTVCPLGLCCPTRQPPAAGG